MYVSCVFGVGISDYDLIEYSASHVFEEQSLSCPVVLSRILLFWLILAP